MAKGGRWGDNGVTIHRKLLDQQAVTPSWGGAQVYIPFHALRTAGFLRRLKLFLNGATYAATLGGGTIANVPAAQLPAARAVSRFQLTMQGIAPIYDVQGLDLLALRYSQGGNFNRLSGDANYALQGAGATAVNGGVSTANWGLQLNVVSPNLAFSYLANIPITEKLMFKDSVIAQGNGTVTIADKMLELGLITLQNTASNVSPTVRLNPMYTLTAGGPDALSVVTGAAVVTGSPSWNLASDLFDVPDDPSQRPVPYQQMFVITRQTFDTPMSGGACTINFKQAGFLMKAAYSFYDSGNNLIDVAPVPAARANFRWGSSVDKFNQTVAEIIGDDVDQYNGFPIGGYLFHDMMQYDGTTTDLVDTSTLANVRTELSGFTTGTTIATVRTLETRLIPVKTG